MRRLRAAIGLLSCSALMLAAAGTADAHERGLNRDSSGSSSSVCQMSYYHETSGAAHWTAYAQTQNGSCSTVGVLLRAVSRFHSQEGSGRCCHHYATVGWRYSSSSVGVRYGGVANPHTVSYSRHYKQIGYWGTTVRLW